jgi:RNA polymerase sigma-70 factor (ECF subfamily)
MPVEELERRLFARFLAGENGALVDLYDRHHLRLYVYALKLTGSATLAEDIVQEMWERVARLRGTSVTVDNPIGLFHRIVKNLFLNHVKARRRFTAFVESSRSYWEHPAIDENAEIVRACMEKLTAEHREVLVLNLYSGYRHEEIAAMLGKSPEAIRKRSSRAQRALRELIVAMRREEQNQSSRSRESGR